jgi:hypothetical protein
VADQKQFRAAALHLSAIFQVWRVCLTQSTINISDRAKVHYCIVYREVAQALHDIQNFAVNFKALIDGTKGMSSLISFIALLNLEPVI